MSRSNSQQRKSVKLSRSTVYGARKGGGLWHRSAVYKNAPQKPFRYLGLDSIVDAAMTEADSLKKDSDK